MSLPKHDEWVDRLREDAPERDEAITELRELLLRGLRRSLHSRTGQFGGGLQAEDIVQEALIRILGSLASFEGRSKFTTWAMTIATRVGISELRKRYTRNVSLNQLTDGSEWTLEVEADSDQEPEHAERSRIMQLLHHAIEGNLTEKQRFAIRALLEGIPVDEIARRTNSNRNAIYKLVHDARVRLKQGFEQSGVSVEDFKLAFE